MATNDGYSPYPLGITASEATTAILKAHNFEDSINAVLTAHGFHNVDLQLGEMEDNINIKSEFNSDPTAPVNPNAGDTWTDPDGVSYTAYTDGTNPVWLEA